MTKESDLQQDPGIRKILIKADKKLYNIPVDEITYIKSIGDYLQVFARERSIVTHETMKSMEGRLPEFIRIHKSYLVPLSGIEYLEGNEVSVGPVRLPVGPSYKAVLLERLSVD